jgi:hypothetical protein
MPGARPDRRDREMQEWPRLKAARGRESLVDVARVHARARAHFVLPQTRPISQVESMPGVWSLVCTTSVGGGRCRAVCLLEADGRPSAAQWVDSGMPRPAMEVS